ncbi:MAG: hypothetical protein IV100_14540 [Myxococcales bacterium]|nr:hypothetical protein [Myxococcales bacterium]
MHPFWVTDCNRARAEQLLTNRPELTFLIRACSIPSCHAISYVAPSAVRPRAPVPRRFCVDRELFFFFFFFFFFSFRFVGRRRRGARAD